MQVNIYRRFTRNNANDEVAAPSCRRRGRQGRGRRQSFSWRSAHARRRAERVWLYKTVVYWVSLPRKCPAARRGSSATPVRLLHPLHTTDRRSATPAASLARPATLGLPWQMSSIECPVCGQQQPSATIEAHINRCLDSCAPHHIPSPRKKRKSNRCRSGGAPAAPAPAPAAPAPSPAAKRRTLPPFPASPGHPGLINI